MTGDRDPYADMLDMPHHQSDTHPHMSMAERAAQFNPFAALAGFDDVIAETGRLTDRRIELSDTEKERLDRILMRIARAVRSGRRPRVTVRYFVPDPRKEGGSCEDITGRVRDIDAAERTMVFLAENGRSKGRAVRIDDILDIRGESGEPPRGDGR